MLRFALYKKRKQMPYLKSLNIMDETATYLTIVDVLGKKKESKE